MGAHVYKWYQWVRLGTNGYQWVPMGTKWVQLGTNGYKTIAMGTYGDSNKGWGWNVAPMGRNGYTCVRLTANRDK